MDISTSKSLYLESCERHGVLPNFAILSSLSKEFELSNTSAVDIVHRYCVMDEESILSLMRTINLKLETVSLLDISEGFLSKLSEGGLTCKVLNLRSKHIQRLRMVGDFTHLHTLNLDFCTMLTSLQKDCFSCMPNLMCLSMCETRIGDLWTTTAALAKLPSLVELRFQKCLCCEDTGPCPSSSDGKAKIHENVLLNHLKICCLDSEVHASSTDQRITYSFAVSAWQRRSDFALDNCEFELSSHLQRVGLLRQSSDVLHNLSNPSKFRTKIKDMDQFLVNVREQVPKKYAPHHPSPICFERHYREYMVACLPWLEVLDNLPIKESDKKVSKTTFSRYYECLPYKRKHKQSAVDLLLRREAGIGGLKCNISSNNQCSISKSLVAAKFGSSPWPLVHAVSSFTPIFKERSKRIRPRQFEYHPSNSSLMAFGTLDGEIAVINHESGNMVCCIPSVAETSSVLGLSWLKRYPSQLITGCDDGSLKLFNIDHWCPRGADISFISETSGTVTYDNFKQLTSVHVNATDDQFLASGYCKSVALYDISSGKCLQKFTDIHREPINVAKFSHHSPFLFATSSFDRDIKMWDLRQNPLRPCYTTSSLRGNVMVCFSPDDHYLLVSAVDNEVRQLLAVDGRLQMNFEIASTGSAHNYTRSYYMNGRDYIISGSCDENIVRVCCAQSGRRLKDVYMEDPESGNSMFVQSLRGDPFREFHMSVLVNSTRPTLKWDILKVNLLASSHDSEESSYNFVS